MSDAGVAAQLMLTMGPRDRGDRLWIARAISSLPVPVSPVTSTVESVGATLATSDSASWRARDVPTMSSKTASRPGASRSGTCPPSSAQNMANVAELLRSSALTRLGVIAVASTAGRLFEACLENVYEDRLSDRLPQEGDGSPLLGPALLFVARPGGDEHDGDEHAAGDQPALELEPVHAGHADIEDQASRVGGHSGVQKLLGRPESLGLISERPDEPAGRHPNGGVVIHDRHQRLRTRW